MLTAKDIKDKAERSYKDFLISVLRRETFFPHHIRGSKGNANLPLQELYPALKHLIDNAKEKTGFGYSLTYKEVNTRHSGIITLPDAIFFENIQDYLKFLDKESEFLAFRKAVEITRNQAPNLLSWIENNALKCQKYATEWADFLQIVVYFKENPTKKHGYWRQLPVEVDLPALEMYQPIIAELLEATLPAQAINHEYVLFEPRFGLAYDEPMIRLRWLDIDAMPSSMGHDMALPLSSLVNWDNTPCENVFLITDKSVFLSFPKHPLSMALFFEHPIAVFSDINWLKTKNVYFTDDISPKGFELLSATRAILPQTKAFLMDKLSFDSFPKHHETQKLMPNTPSFLPYLTEEEHSFYQYLLNLKEKNALLQRHIAYPYLKKQCDNL